MNPLLRPPVTQLTGELLGGGVLHSVSTRGLLQVKRERFPASSDINLLQLVPNPLHLTG